MDGWLKLHRELIDKPIWANSTLEQRVILITLLCMANHQPNKWEFDGKVYEVQPGQFITSIPSIVKKCKCEDVTYKKVRTALERFEKLGFLACKTTNKNRLITIVNWGFYQSDTDSKGRQEGRQRADRGQTEGRQRAANKECKNNKNDKNDKNIAAAAAETSAIDYYKNNINPTASPLEVKKLAIWVKELDKQSKGDDVVICAIDDAVMCNHRSLRYIERILDRCEKQGIYTAEAFAAQKDAFAAQKKAKSTGRAKVNTFTNYEQRQYTDDDFGAIIRQKEADILKGGRR